MRILYTTTDVGPVGRAEVVEGFFAPTEVYYWCMSRTNIDIDDEACRAIMQRYDLGSKREAVNLALRRLAAEPLDVDVARRLRGAGWDGDLDQMRTSRAR
jgi:Arc/MetJ family transcription regulator